MNPNQDFLKNIPACKNQPYGKMKCSPFSLTITGLSKQFILALFSFAVLSCNESSESDNEQDNSETETATLIAAVNFDDNSVSDGWGIGTKEGATYAFENSDIPGSDASNKALKVNYPIPVGASYFYLNYYVSSLNIRDIAVDFWAKMPSENKHGLKFVKVFGQETEQNMCANTTFGLDYTGIDNGAFYSVNFGDGEDKSNDTQNIIRFDGKEPNLIGRSYGTATVETPQSKYWTSGNWGTDWHHFRLRVKFNSGTTKDNEVADGEYYIEIDDKVYVNAKGVFNRHYSNLPIQKVSFGGWSQDGTEPFEIWYDDIKVTTGGFID